MTALTSALTTIGQAYTHERNAAYYKQYVDYMYEESLSDYAYFKKAARDTLNDLHLYTEACERNQCYPHTFNMVCARLLNRAGAYRRHAVRAR